MDLDQLREERRLLRSAAKTLTRAGELLMLAKESHAIENQLKEIVRTNYDKSIPGANPIDLAQPLSTRVVQLAPSEPEPLPWQRMRLMSLRDRYAAYRDRCEHYNLPSIPFVPADLSLESIVQELQLQRRAIQEQYEMALTGYEERGHAA